MTNAEFMREFWEKCLSVFDVQVLNFPFTFREMYFGLFAIGISLIIMRSLLNITVKSVDKVSNYSVKRRNLPLSKRVSVMNRK